LNLHASPWEARAVETLLAHASVAPLEEELAVILAKTLVERGDAARAIPLLASATTSAALLMSADLAADIGELPRAIATIERVLLRSLDYPGARERHRRWRTALGYDAAPPRSFAGATRVVANASDMPFVLLRELARGGTGAVYEAEDRELARRVAVKVYYDRERDEGRAQLLHEARVAASLAGPGIVRVFDADPAHGFLALELSPLGALRDAIRARDLTRLTPIERWLAPLAAALARVHAAGWVHNDVKPANVLLRAAASPVLSDFGIARRAGVPSPAGSLGYVSPERLAGRPSDPRDDVYGFGRLLDDVLDVLDMLDANDANDATGIAYLRQLAAACVGPDESRPADGHALATRLRVEAHS
jgi:eukaryotic-like serine/threonine-protein kinase